MSGYPSQEFKQTVVSAAQTRTPGVTLRDIAQRADISTATLRNWMKDSLVPAASNEAHPQTLVLENRSLRKRLRNAKVDGEVRRQAMDMCASLLSLSEKVDIAAALSDRGVAVARACAILELPTSNYYRSRASRHQEESVS